MKPFETPDLLAEIEDLLHEERAALRAADFAGLAPLAVRKDRLLDRLGLASRPQDEVGVDRIRRAAQRNQRLLLASLRGVRAARQRLEDIKSARSVLNTYDHLGNRQDIHLDIGNLEHRA